VKTRTLSSVTSHLSQVSLSRRWPNSALRRQNNYHCHTGDVSLPFDVALLSFPERLSRACRGFRQFNITYLSCPRRQMSGSAAAKDVSVVQAGMYLERMYWAQSIPSLEMPNGITDSFFLTEVFERHLQIYIQTLGEWFKISSVNGL
jgi:hypothetical protein